MAMMTKTSLVEMAKLSRGTDRVCLSFPFAPELMILTLSWSLNARDLEDLQPWFGVRVLGPCLMRVIWFQLNRREAEFLERSPHAEFQTCMMKSKVATLLSTSVVLGFGAL